MHMLKLDLDYIMDAVDGTLLSDATGDFIFNMHFDEVFTDCSMIEKIAIYFPEEKNHKFNYVTKKFFRFVKKCIQSVRSLRLVSPSSKYLDLIGLSHDAETQVESLSITDVSRLASENRLIGRNMPHLKQIISIQDSSELSQFAANKSVKQLTSKGRCTETGFAALLSFIRRNELTDLLLLCEPITEIDGETPEQQLDIAEIFRKIKTVRKKPLEYLRVIYLQGSTNFSYSHKHGIIQVPIDYINQIDISLDYQHFEITHIKSDEQVTQLSDFLQNIKSQGKSMETLVVNVDAKLWKNVWKIVNEIPRAIVRCNKDLIWYVEPAGYFATTSGLQENHPYTQLHAYTRTLLEALTNEIESLRVSYFGYNNKKLISRLANRIVAMENLLYLYVDNNNGLFGALQDALTENKGFALLHTLNIPKTALFPFDQHITPDSDKEDILDRSLTRVIIRIDDKRDTSVPKHIEWLSDTYGHMTWAKDEDGNIEGLKKEFTARRRANS